MTAGFKAEADPTHPDHPKHAAPEQPRVATLTALDRCDAPCDPFTSFGPLTDRHCGAQAYVAVTIPHDASATELLFCSHHYAQHEQALLPYLLDPANVRDERWQLEEAEIGRKRDGVSA